MNQERQNHRKSWHKLDNTANLFPVITSRRFSNVYRLSITLHELVDPELLQQSLETVLPRFAAFRVRMKRGLFWFYLESNPKSARVREEDGYPCAYIDPIPNEDFLFQLTYYKNRINLDVYHVLSDGTGGFHFLQAICCDYLMLAHPSAFSDEEKKRLWFGEHAVNTEDSYVANYAPSEKSSFNEGKGYKLTGERYLADPVSVIHAYVHLPGMLAFCRSKGVSLTHYVTACLGWAVYTEQLHMRTPRRPLNIMIPVNLRNIFPSSTQLNFFSSIYVCLDFKKPDITFDDVLIDVKQQFTEKITRESMLKKISYTVGGGNHPLVRAVPLPLKMLFLRWIFWQSAKTSTMGLSNTGRVDFPEVFQPYISGTLSMVSTVQGEPFKCTTSSYKDVFALSFTSILRNTSLQRAIIRKMADDGLDVVVESNGVDYDTM